MSQSEEKDGDVPEVDIESNPIHLTDKELRDLFGSDSEEEQVAVAASGKNNASDSEEEEEGEEGEEEGEE